MFAFHITKKIQNSLIRAIPYWSSLAIIKHVTQIPWPPPIPSFPSLPVRSRSLSVGVLFLSLYISFNAVCAHSWRVYTLLWRLGVLALAMNLTKETYIWQKRHTKRDSLSMLCVCTLGVCIHCYEGLVCLQLPWIWQKRPIYDERDIQKETYLWQKRPMKAWCACSCHEFDKRDLYMTKETCKKRPFYDKRDLWRLVVLAAAINLTKETYIWQKRPTKWGL